MQTHFSTLRFGNALKYADTLKKRYAFINNLKYTDTF